MTCLGECDENYRPHIKEECELKTPCQGEWLTGRWSVCSHSCGNGVQSRTVECARNTPEGRQIESEESCAWKKKPKEERKCHIQSCVGEWFTEEWSEVSYERQIARKDPLTFTVHCQVWRGEENKKGSLSHKWQDK